MSRWNRRPTIPPRHRGEHQCTNHGLIWMDSPGRMGARGPATTLCGLASLVMPRVRVPQRFRRRGIVLPSPGLLLEQADDIPHAQAAARGQEYLPAFCHPFRQGPPLFLGGTARAAQASSKPRFFSQIATHAMPRNPLRSAGHVLNNWRRCSSHGAPVVLRSCAGHTPGSILTALGKTLPGSMTSLNTMRRAKLMASLSWKLWPGSPR